MKEELLFTAIETELQIADSMELIAPKKYEEEIKESDNFIEKTNCILEKTRKRVDRII